MVWLRNPSVLFHYNHEANLRSLCNLICARAHGKRKDNNGARLLLIPRDRAADKTGFIKWDSCTPTSYTGFSLPALARRPARSRLKAAHFLVFIISRR